MEPRICPGCGGDRLHAGNLHAGGFGSHLELHFRMQSTKFLTLRTSEVRVEAHVCEDCGLICMFGDTEHIRAIKPGEPEPR